ncbi:divalent-cation tolerance protein CutA [Desulfovibrio sp. ZJ200]|uniref:divalent-cation tolerance protein CutA n=1 Tax=Desulfovibrio sp. ZJ200 TaxID=2709792 RepID=UPI0013EBE72E|nr:divalent-cation tolerance protein CutA [Desulfovibrio sp. ZJ200]
MSFLAYVTVPHEAEARALARLLVESRLAAGVNLLPGVISVYRWQGKVCEAGEWLLLAQVSRAAFPEFCAAVRRAHSYEVPCIAALPLEAGHQPFLRWIEENSLPPAE